jgi:hypothetical protein
MLQTVDHTSVAFPPGQRKSESPVFVRNELFIAAPAERVFGALVRASAWPSFYANAKDIELEGNASELTLGTVFHWTTLGTRVHTTITEFLPNTRLAWSGRGNLGATGYHGWVIEPKDNGCLVITEETQQGLLPSVARLLLRRGLKTWHQRWLEGLARATTTADACTG